MGLLRKAGPTEPVGAVKIVIRGVEKRKRVEYVVTAKSKGGMMEGTGFQRR